MFRSLRKAQVKRHNLYLAWDFTVASDENIAGRLLHMRDDAFAQLGDTDPRRTASSRATRRRSTSTPSTEDSEPRSDRQRRVTGTFTVPCYLTNNCEPPAVTSISTRTAIRSSTAPTRPTSTASSADRRRRPAVSRAARRCTATACSASAGEVSSSPQRSLAQAHNFVFCATDEIGFAEEDIPNTIGILQNMGRFPELTDRIQQGLLERALPRAG